MRVTRIIVALAALLASPGVYAQSVLLQGGAWTPGHVPVYVGQGTSQPVVLDGGPAGGGQLGVGLSELGITATGPGVGPYAALGTGALGTNVCDYDAPVTNPGGYHFLCFSANAQGGGLLAYGAVGAAPQEPFQVSINGILSALGTGTVKSVATNAGLTGGPITVSGTIGLATIGAHDLLSNITGVDVSAECNTLTAIIIRKLERAGRRALPRCGSVDRSSARDYRTSACERRDSC